MENKRDRSNEMQIYISKEHHAALKRLSEAEGRTMRRVIEGLIENRTSVYSLAK